MVGPCGTAWEMGGIWEGEAVSAASVVRAGSMAPMVDAAETATRTHGLEGGGR